jgi:hypothetical protein
MLKPLALILPDDWKQRTHVFVTRKTPVQTMTPLVPKAAYDADRNNGRTEVASPPAMATRKLVLQY